MMKAVEPLSNFELAADAIVDGDLLTLKRLLEEGPELVWDRSTREHNATLLHYVSANGVEDIRQKTPTNIVEITDLLLRSGAAVDTTANIYGGGATTLGLVATSIHPERAGLQQELLQTLLDHGAKNDLSLVSAAMANGRHRAAEFLASKLQSLDFVSAAAVGRLEVVKDAMHAGVSPEHLLQGFLYACAAGRDSVVEFLLENGANVAMQDRHGQTGLHWAAIGAHLATVNLLLRHNPPLELKNVYGGTVLGQTWWSAGHSDDPAKYAVIADTLLAAGAQSR